MFLDGVDVAAGTARWPSEKVDRALKRQFIKLAGLLSQYRASSLIATVDLVVSSGAHTVAFTSQRATQLERVLWQDSSTSADDWVPIYRTPVGRRRSGDFDARAWASGLPTYHLEGETLVFSHRTTQAETVRVVLRDFFESWTLGSGDTPDFDLQPYWLEFVVNSAVLQAGIRDKQQRTMVLERIQDAEDKILSQARRRDRADVQTTRDVEAEELGHLGHQGLRDALTLGRWR